MSFVREMVRRGDVEDCGIRDLPWMVNNTGRIIVNDEKVMAVLMQKHPTYDTEGNIVEIEVDEDDRMTNEFEIWLYEDVNGNDVITDKIAVSRELATGIVNCMLSYISDRYKV